jgi:hypothetical protein
LSGRELERLLPSGSNAALVEQSAAAADSLGQQTKRLVDAVSQFKLGREDLAI